MTFAVKDLRDEDDTPGDLVNKGCLSGLVLNQRISSQEITGDYGSGFYVFRVPYAPVLWTRVYARLGSSAGNCLFRV
jgi:hypothetical protein